METDDDIMSAEEFFGGITEGRKTHRKCRSRGKKPETLFAAVKVGRFCGVDPEAALHRTCEKFLTRFRSVEEAAAAQNTAPDKLSLEELTALWNAAKQR